MICGVFEQEYRIQLAQYLRSLLHELDGPLPTRPAEDRHTGQEVVPSGQYAHDPFEQALSR